MHPNSKKQTKMSVSGPMGWIGCVPCEIFRRDFVSRSFALVRPFCTEFRKATKRSQMHPHCTHQNVGLGSYKVDWVRSLRKILTRLHGSNFFTSSARFAPSSETQPNGPKCSQIVRNTTKRQFRVYWGGSGAFVDKNSDATSWHELLH